MKNSADEVVVLVVTENGVEQVGLDRFLEEVVAGGGIAPENFEVQEGDAPETLSDEEIVEDAFQDIKEGQEEMVRLAYAALEMLKDAEDALLDIESIADGIYTGAAAINTLSSEPQLTEWSDEVITRIRTFQHRLDLTLELVGTAITNVGGE